MFVVHKVEKKHVLASFWLAEWGYEFFKETMSHNRFQEIMWFLRLTKRRPVAEVWDRFVQNSIACYKPGADITTDEQLFPTKARCSFSQYIASKPNNSGIKFHIDIDTKYMVNSAPYLVKNEMQRPSQRQGESLTCLFYFPQTGQGTTG